MEYFASNCQLVQKSLPSILESKLFLVEEAQTKLNLTQFATASFCFLKIDRSDTVQLFGVFMKELFIFFL